MRSDNDIYVQPGEGEHLQGAEEHVQEEGVAGELHQGEVAVHIDEN